MNVCAFDGQPRSARSTVNLFRARRLFGRHRKHYLGALASQSEPASRILIPKRDGSRELVCRTSAKLYRAVQLQSHELLRLCFRENVETVELYSFQTRGYKIDPLEMYH